MPCSYQFICIIIKVKWYKVVQLSLPFIEEQRQLDADRRHWEKRLQAIATELISEPARIEAAYKVKAVRVEPVGVIYLWPISG